MVNVVWQVVTKIIEIIVIVDFLVDDPDDHKITYQKSNYHVYMGSYSFEDWLVGLFLYFLIW